MRQEPSHYLVTSELLGTCVAAAEILAERYGKECVREVGNAFMEEFIVHTASVAFHWAGIAEKLRRVPGR